MIVLPTNPNLIYVGMVRTGCFKTQFNSAYPTRLNGIINQHEFRESIVNINSKISSNKSQIFWLVFFILCTIGGLALAIVAGTLPASAHTSSSSFLILLGIGIGLIAFAPIFYFIATCIIRKRRTTKMREAIAEESKKYSMRSPACSWKLTVNIIWTGGYGRYRRTLYFYRIIIDTHHYVAPRGSARLNSNPVASRPTSTVRLQDDILPPPYPGHPVAFCSQCGVQRPGPTAKFCTSCGYPFDKY